MIYTLKAPAKINIGLRILSKREDGYHNIETIFYPVKLYDTIKLNISTDRKANRKSSIEVTTDSPELRSGMKNTCYHAVDLFFKQFNIPGEYEIKIHIKKNIPNGAGLGGGSSDAGAVLLSLFKHFKSQMSGIASPRARGPLRSSQIKRLAGRIGSDVPYFVNYELRIRNYELKPAYATGRGEKLKPLPNFKINYPILVVYPGINISTKWAYSKIKNQKSKIKKLKNVKQFIPNEPKLFKNDFEQIVFKKYPAIKQIKDKMYESGAMFSSMSGSGSAVYGIFKDSNGLGKCKRYFERKSYNVYNV